MSEHAVTWFANPEFLKRMGRDSLRHFFAAFGADIHAGDVTLPDPNLPDDLYFAEAARFLEARRRRLWLTPRHLPVVVRVAGLTLEPLRELGADALDPGHAPGIARITLCEIRVIHNNGQCHTRTCEADDLFHAQGADAPPALPRAGRLTRATVRVQFTDSTTPRTVVLCPPHTIQLTQMSDVEAVKQWLEGRGFVKRET